MVSIWGEGKARRGEKQCQDGVEVAVSGRVGREAPTEMMGQGGWRGYIHTRVGVCLVC